MIHELDEHEWILNKKKESTLKECIENHKVVPVNLGYRFFKQGLMTSKSFVNILIY